MEIHVSKERPDKFRSLFIHISLYKRLIMGCHTWFYRRCNQEEMNAIKQNAVDWLLKKYNLWENAVNKRYDLIPWDDIDFYLPLDRRSDYDTIEKYTEHVYNMLYTYEYEETIQGIEELIKKHPDYFDLDFNSLPEYQQHELNLKVNYYNGFDNFLELQEYIKTYYEKSFDEFCAIERNKYRNVLKNSYGQGPLEFVNLIKNAEYIAEIRKSLDLEAKNQHLAQLAKMPELLALLSNIQSSVKVQPEVSSKITTVSNQIDGVKSTLDAMEKKIGTTRAASQSRPAEPKDTTQKKPWLKRLFSRKK